jgi:hypothetical protein
MKYFKIILAFLIGFLIISIFYSILHFLFVKSAYLILDYKFLTYLIYIITGGLLMGGIGYLGMHFNVFLFKISNNKKANNLIILLSCLINLILEIHSVWTLNGIEYTGTIKMLSKIYTLIIGSFSLWFFLGSNIDKNRI